MSDKGKPTASSVAGTGGAYAWLVWALAAISFGYAFFHRVAPSVMVSDLMVEFTIGGALRTRANTSTARKNPTPPSNIRLLRHPNSSTK